MATSMEGLEVLQAAESVADTIWANVVNWDELAKDTVGKQMVRAADSIGANIAESFGRFRFGEKVEFLYYARGRLFETKYWMNRAAQRRLMPATTVEELNAQLTALAKQMNAFAKNLKIQKVDEAKGRAVREVGIEYEVEQRADHLFDEADFRWLESPIYNL
jgi:four helix bundle protein